MIQSRKYFYILIGVFTITLLFVSTAGAAGDYLATLAPTRDYRTPPSTPTTSASSEQLYDMNSDSYDCPSGGVAGYGLVTPDAMWLAVCGHCIPTETPVPTYDLNLFPTGIYVNGGSPLPPVCITVPAGGEICNTVTPGIVASTVTPFPTSTTAPTIPPTSIPDSQLLKVFNVSGSTNNFYLNQFSYTYTFDPAVGVLSDDHHVIAHIAYNDSSISQSGNGGINFYIDPQIGSGSQTIYVHWNITNVVGGQPYIKFDNSSLYTFNTASGDYQITKVYNGNLIIYAGASTDNPYTGAISADVEIFVSAYPIDLSTPTPMVTVTPEPGTNYCDSVNNGMADLTDQDIKFWKSAGAPACIIIPAMDTTELYNASTTLTWLSNFFGAGVVTGISAFIASATAVFQITTPAVTICLQPYEFMPINLFGNVFLVTTFFDLILGMYIISVFTSR